MLLAEGLLVQLAEQLFRSDLAIALTTHGLYSQYGNARASHRSG
jgi:hypothetical protein